MATIIALWRKTYWCFKNLAATITAKEPVATYTHEGDLNYFVNSLLINWLL